MTDWIWAFASADKAHALERWKTTGGTAWLLAAMVGLRPGDPDLAVIMNAAQRLSKDSPAYTTAQYHRIRFLMESGKNDEAREALDAHLPGFRTALQNSSLNLFLAQRLRLARNFDEFLAFAPRIPQSSATVSLEPALKEYSDPGIPLFDADSASVLNRGLPLSLLSQAAMGKLPLHLRKQLIRSAWVRAVLLGDSRVAGELTSPIRQIFPELETDLKVWGETKDAGAKDFALALLLMRHPGMSPYLQSGMPRRGTLRGINNGRENWWCGFNADGGLDAPTGSRYNLSRSQQQEKPPEPAEFPAFLSVDDRARFWAEWKKLAAVPTAPNYFGKAVLAWAVKNPKDARVPEALHGVVKSTRFGCTDPESGNYSQAAFRLLHSRYPNTEWAKSTPYWYR
jgi:hypothetical protein